MTFDAQPAHWLNLISLVKLRCERGGSYQLINEDHDIQTKNERILQAHAYHISLHCTVLHSIAFYCSGFVLELPQMFILSGDTISDLAALQ